MPFNKLSILWVFILYIPPTKPNHSHKKRKDSLKTLAELAALRSYIENQTLLERILLYWASKCKQTKEQGSENCLWTNIDCCQLFYFFCQDAKQNKIKLCYKRLQFVKETQINTCIKHRTESREPNNVARSKIYL